MAGLVSAYGSDDEDDTTEVDRKPKSDAVESPWTECVDATTGYPYFWNTVTNEVRWERPSESSRSTPPRSGKAVPTLPAVRNSQPAGRNSQPTVRNSQPAARIPQPTVRNPQPAVSAGAAAAAAAAAARKLSDVMNKRQQMAVSTSKMSTKKSKREPVFYGPSLPEPRPEEIALQKIKKFEEEVSANVLKSIQAEAPPDWENTMPRALHTEPFKWDQKKKLLPIWRELARGATSSASTSDSSSNAMALIAGVYGDSDEEPEPEPTTPVKRKIMAMQVKSLPKSKVPKTSLKAVPSIFQEEDKERREDEEKQLDHSVAPKIKEEKRDKRGRKVYDSSIGRTRTVT